MKYVAYLSLCVGLFAASCSAPIQPTTQTQCGTASQSCTVDSDCCGGFTCAGGICVFQETGNGSGTVSGGSGGVGTGSGASSGGGCEQLGGSCSGDGQCCNGFYCSGGSCQPCALSGTSCLGASCCPGLSCEQSVCSAGAGNSSASSGGTSGAAPTTASSTGGASSSGSTSAGSSTGLASGSSTGGSSSAGSSSGGSSGGGSSGVDGGLCCTATSLGCYLAACPGNVSAGNICCERTPLGCGPVSCSGTSGGSTGGSSLYCTSCSDASQCGGGLNECIFLGGQPPGFCGTDCSQGQACPLGASCIAVTDADGGPNFEECAPALGGACPIDAGPCGETGASCASGGDCCNGCCAPATNADGDPVGPLECKPADGAHYDCCDPSSTTACADSADCCFLNILSLGTTVGGYCATPCTSNSQCGAAQCETSAVFSICGTAEQNVCGP